MKGRDAFCNREAIAEEIYYETRYTFVLYNIAPLLPGHSLIVPKRHISDFTELTKNELLDMLAVIRRITPVLLKRYGCNAYVITAQIGKSAGMTVGHLHIQLVPRRSDDKYSGKENNRLYDRLYGKVNRMTAKREWIYAEALALRKRLASK